MATAQVAPLRAPEISWQATPATCTGGRTYGR